MSLLDLFRKSPPPPPQPVVIISVPRDAAGVKDDTSDYEGSDLMQLEDALADALAAANAGQFDENPFFADRVDIRFSGAETAAMLRAVKPVLRTSVLGRKARIFSQPGGEGTPQTEVPTDD